MSDNDSVNFTLVPCPICKRSFRDSIIQRHKVACQKLANKKRKIFDSGKQRLIGTGASLDKRIKPGEKVPKPTTDPKIIQAEKRKNNWRIKHEQFISTLQANRSNSKAGPNAVFKPSPVDPSLVLCQYCNRRFNEHAAERHIPLCKDKSGVRNVLTKPAPASTRKTAPSTVSSSSSVTGMKKPNPTPTSSSSLRPSEASSKSKVTSSKKTAIQVPSSRACLRSKSVLTRSSGKSVKSVESDDRSGDGLSLLKLTIDEKKNDSSEDKGQPTIFKSATPTRRSASTNRVHIAPPRVLLKNSVFNF